MQEPGMKCGGKEQTLTELLAILRISGPLAAAYLAEIAMGITDMLFVGRLGGVELAAVGLASSVLFEILIVAVGVVSMVAVLAAEARGANSSEGVRRAVRQGFNVRHSQAIARRRKRQSANDFLQEVPDRRIASRRRRHNTDCRRG